MIRRHHDFHIVKPSVWPILVSIGLFSIVINLVGVFQGLLHSFFFVLISVIFLCLTIAQWIRDMIRENLYLKKHTLKVKKGISVGFALFIVSEILFFASFFWALFHNKLNPSIELGSIWPPFGLVSMKIAIPLANTCILLTSGATITIAHLYIKKNKNKEGIIYFFFTIMLAIIFLLAQLFEYKNSPFSISEGIYGSVFFMLTGFHGFHVILGAIMITVQCLRYIKKQYGSKNHVGFETAAWYWHFVDVVWLFLFLFLYINI